LFLYETQCTLKPEQDDRSAGSSCANPLTNMFRSLVKVTIKYILLDILCLSIADVTPQEDEV